jgi:hypothetical protein
VTSSKDLPDWDGPLHAPEQAMIQHAVTGEVLDLLGGGIQPDDQAPAELEEMQAWGADRNIRAEVLRHLLVHFQWPVHAKGVRLRGARISGRLDLESATLRCPLVMEDCYFDSERPLVLDYATVSLLRLVRSRLAGLTADRVTVTKEIDLIRSTFTGTVILLGARITGQLICRDVKITGTDTNHNALVADGVKVDAIFLNDGFVADGAVRLSGADIAGSLYCGGAKITGTDTNHDALVAEGVKVGGDILLSPGFVADGAVRLLGADVAGSLDCGGAKITGTDTDALVANRVKVGGAIFLNDGFVADGAVRLLSADIAGSLYCGGAKITGTDANHNALVADAVKVGGRVFLSAGFTADGAVRLHSADIGLQLDCSGAKITRTDKRGNGLVADGVKVGGDVFLRDGFTSAGTVGLRGARIDGGLFLQQATLAHTVALEAQGARIGQELSWAPTRAVTGLVNLDRVQANRLDDDWSKAGAYWPAAGNLRLAGFVYDGFGGKHLASCRQRLDWVRSQHRKPQPDKPARFGAQPYEQLASVYRQMGHERCIDRWATKAMPVGSPSQDATTCALTGVWAGCGG